MSGRKGSSLAGACDSEAVAVHLERLVLQTAGDVRRVRMMADSLYCQMGGLSTEGGWRRGRLWHGAY